MVRFLFARCSLGRVPSSWTAEAKVRGQTFGPKWHVGRAMLDWFYEQQLADEFERLNVLHSRPNKPDYEMYRIIWKDAGRSSPEVAAICTALRQGPQPGYKRGAKPPPAHGGELELDEPRPEPSPKAVAGWHTSLVAEREVELAEGGWVYCYTYEVMYRQAQALGEVPLLKVGHSSGHYTERIRTQWSPLTIPCSDLVVTLRR